MRAMAFNKGIILFLLGSKEQQIIIAPIRAIQFPAQFINTELNGSNDKGITDPPR